MLRVADLGCGNGVLGIVYALNNPQAELTLVDDFMAVQSARENWQAVHGQRPVEVRAGNSLAEQPPAWLDLVLCNPPFHQQQVVGDFLAWRMFTQAKAALRQGGELSIIGNRHLGYHLKLKRLYGRVEQVGGDAQVRHPARDQGLAGYQHVCRHFAAPGLADQALEQRQSELQRGRRALAGDAVAIDHHRLIDEHAAAQPVAHARIAGDAAPLSTP
ncbi:Ribosomal RNA large subunit methyltransferase G [Stutzerimonas stutzeri]